MEHRKNRRRKVTKTPFLVSVGENIRTLRKSAHLTQEELAFAAGLHPTYVGAIERGERNFSIDVLERLAEAFKIEPADLIKS